MGLRGSSCELIFLWEQRGKRRLRLNHTARKFHEWVSLQMLELKQSVLSAWGMQVREINCSTIENYMQNPSLRNLHCKTSQNKVTTWKLPSNETQINNPSPVHCELALCTSVGFSWGLLVSQVSHRHFSWSYVWFAHDDSSLSWIHKSMLSVEKFPYGSVLFKSHLIA